MKRLLLILCTLIACAPDDPMPPPIDPGTGGNVGPYCPPVGCWGDAHDDSDETPCPEHELPDHCDGTGDGVMSEDGEDGHVDTGADSGEIECGDEWAAYRCRGFVVGWYLKEGEGTLYRFSSLDLAGTDAFECISGDDMIVPHPYIGEGDSEELFQVCRNVCEEINWEFPATIGQYEFTGQTTCVFEEGGAGGYAPKPNGGSAGVADCENIDPAEEPQIEYLGPADGDACLAVDCSNWNTLIASIPPPITHSVSGTTHTATISAYLLNAIVMGGAVSDLYQCDTGRFQQTVSGNSESWAFSGLSSSDALYAAGFRNGDRSLTIRRNTSGATVYQLSSYANMATAMLMLSPYSSFVVTAKRTDFGGTSTHTWTITLN